MSSTKRRRGNKDIKCVFFPDDLGSVVKEVRREPSSLSSASSARSWQKCGDSFLNSPLIKNLKSSGRKLSDIRKLAQSPASVQNSAVCHNEDPVHITWSSSDSEYFEDEAQEQHLSRPVAKQQQQQQRRRGPQRPGRPTAPIQSYTKALCMLGTDKDDIPVIDTDSDLDESEEDAGKDSEQQISDCESSDGEPGDVPVKPTTVAELEISGYASDGEDVGDTLSSSRPGSSENFPLQTGEGSKRSVSDWVRSAHAMLQTPQKQFDRQSKTPEDSAKKRRKFQSGGLAERLNRLQRRQRSAISFWRHQSISDTAGTTVDRPGVLALEVLEVQEECTMQLVHCECRRPPGEAHQRSHPVSEESTRTLVLFNRATAAQLSPAHGDIIHIYPPWQSLSMEGFSCNIILNTHFSQKVCSASKLADVSVARGLLPAERCGPYSLCQIFGLLGACGTTEKNNTKQVAVTDGLCTFGGSGVLSRNCLSLLEAIEGLGQAGSVGQDVLVVIQRVYSIRVPDVSILKRRVPPRSSSAPPLPAEKGKTRLCVLVQDSYGMFSVVQLHFLSSEDDLLRYCRIWQGKACVLRGVKVVQRVTRERCTRLFSLIDCLWPPVLPLKHHGNTPSTSCEKHPPGPAPSFCYLLSGQESSVEPTEDLTVSTLYFPPKEQTLSDILQSKLKVHCCSFFATVIYKRIQNSDVGQGEVWLVLTDPSLQEEEPRPPERPCRRTVALCVNTSCVLTSSVLEALRSPAACCMSFRDAIREHDVFLCAEQSVVELRSDLDPGGCLTSTAMSHSLAQLPTEPQAQPLPRPVRLDPLGLEITPNSLCSLTGMIVGVDVNTAYCWPACNHCGSDSLEMLAQTPETFHCCSCKLVVHKPATRFQMEVFLSSSSLSNCTIKVKLQQKTILSILNVAAMEGNEFPGYDVENVLGKEVGPLTAYVRVVTRKPALWMGLEEICL